MEKVVQTTLPADTYTRLAAQAKKEGKPLKSVLRQAIDDYLLKQLPSWEEDPLQAFIGSWESKEGDWSTRKDWRDPYGKAKREMDEWAKGRAKRRGGQA